MQTNFILSCESTVDLPYSYISGRDIPVLFYSYSVDGESYVDDMLQDPQTLSRFYGFLDAGKLPSTSQINEFCYLEFFEQLLQRGDVLHIAYGKVRGKATAVKTTVDTMERFAQDGAEYAGKCFICHSRCPEDAEKTRAAVEARFPNLRGKIRICEIGTIIASHCGPGTVAVFFLGAERAPE